MVRDYIVYGLLAVIIGGTLLWALWAVVRPSQGQWNDHDREVGRYRAQHWKYQECVPSLKAFLIPEVNDTHHWPALANARGHEALSGRDKSSGILWRSALMESLGESPRLFISVKFAQRADGATAELPEALFSKSHAFYEYSEDCDTRGSDSDSRPEKQQSTWKITSNEPSAAQEIYESLRQIRLFDDSSLARLHCVEDTLTFVFTPEASSADRISLINSCIARAAQCATRLPSRFWEV